MRSQLAQTLRVKGLPRTTVPRQPLLLDKISATINAGKELCDSMCVDCNAS